MTDQKQEGTVDEVKGKAQEAWGNVTGNDDDVAKGKTKQAEGNVRQGLGNLGDAVENITGDDS